jgi:hypothetical protein
MTTMTWMSAPAGFLRRGGFDVRPAFCGMPVRSEAHVAGLQGSRPSAAGIGAVGDLKFISLAPTNGTTLGIPSSWRPQS